MRSPFVRGAKKKVATANGVYNRLAVRIIDILTTSVISGSLGTLINRPNGANTSVGTCHLTYAIPHKNKQLIMFYYYLFI